jgi:hypothetical protein
VALVFGAAGASAPGLLAPVPLIGAGLPRGQFSADAPPLQGRFEIKIDRMGGLKKYLFSANGANARRWRGQNPFLALKNYFAFFAGRS